MKRFFITGFTGLPDLLATVYKVKSIAVNVGALVMVNIIAFAGFIYAPHQIVLVLFSLMMVDWATGVYKAVKFRRFRSYTFQRMIWNIFFTFFLIMVSTMLAKYMWVFGLLKIADVMITGFLLTYFVSIIENLHEIDKRIIPNKFYLSLKRILDIDKVINKYFKDEITKEEAKSEIDTIVADDADDAELPDNEEW